MKLNGSIKLSNIFANWNLPIMVIFEQNPTYIIIYIIYFYYILLDYIYYMWNSIDHNTKEINHRKIFKQKIKAPFLKTYI